MANKELIMEIAKSLNRGKTSRDIAAEFSVHPRHVLRVALMLREKGVKIPFLKDKNLLSFQEIVDKLKKESPELFLKGDLK